MAFLISLSTLFFIFMLSWAPVSCTDTNNKNSLLQGPGPIFSLGHNIFPKNQLVVEEELFFVKIKPNNNSLLINFNNIYYGITNRLSILVTIPVILKEIKIPHKHSRGLGNLIAQAEYAFYEKKEVDALFQWTVLGNVVIPTTRIVANTDVITTRAPSFFCGITTNNLSSVWYTYSDIGVFFTTKRHQFKLGNQLWYGLGGGRKLYTHNKLTLTGLIEMSGIYERPDKIGKKTDLKTGGNRLYLGPTLRIYYGSLVLIGGFQYAIADVSREDISFKYRSVFSASYVF